jgi:WD40 repeat protein
MLGQHCVGIPLLVSQRASGWGPRVKIIYSYAHAAVFSPDSQFILSRSGSAKLWDVATGTQLYGTSNASGGCTAIAFSPDGQSVSCGFQDGTVKLWTIAPWAKQAVLPSFSNAKVKAVTFTPNSQYVVSAFEDGTVRVWALTQQIQEAFTTGCSFSDAVNVVFSLDCRFMAATSWDDGAARVWKLIPGAPPELLVIARPADGSYKAAAFSPDGCTVVFGAEDGIHVWDTATGTQRTTINGHSSMVTAVAFSRDGQFLISGSEDGTIMVWNFTAGAQQPDYVLRGHTGIVRSVAFSPDAKLVVSGSEDDPMRVWSAAVSMNESAMEGHTGVVTDIAFSHDGRHIASGSEDSTVRVWDAVTGRQKYVLEAHAGWIERVVFSPDSQTVASCSWDNTVRLWDVATGIQVHGPFHHRWESSYVVFSHDGQSIAVVSALSRKVSVWEVTTGTQKFAISYSPSQLRSHRGADPVMFSPRYQLLVATLHSKPTSLPSDRSDGKFDTDYKVWDASTGVELAARDLTPALARDVEGALRSRNERAVTGPYYIRVSSGWIIARQDGYDRHLMCRLPAERRPLPWGPHAHHGQKVCIGAMSGAVTILDFSNVPMPWVR